MITTLFIDWQPDPIAFHVLGRDVRWYSLCWALALGAGYVNMLYLYKKQQLSSELCERLFIHCFLGVLIGARLGHCLFYEPSYYLSHPVEMLLPIKRFADGWKMVGYEGLSSHGGVFGMLVAIWMYSRKTKIGLLHVLDNMGLITPMSAAFIRLGNLFNSEIVGLPTEKAWGFVFLNNGENFARHPAQLYESLFYLLLFFVFRAVYYLRGKEVGKGFYFGLCLTSIFVFRIVIELLKEDQEAFEANYILNMGQVLSLPLVAVGIYFLIKGSRQAKTTTSTSKEKKL